MSLLWSIAIRLVIFGAGILLFTGCASLPHDTYRHPTTYDVIVCQTPKESQMSPALGLLAILPGGAGAATAIAVTHARPYADTYVQCKRDAEAAGYERWERE